MIISSTQRTAYHFFAHLIGLLIVYAAAALIGAVLFLDDSGLGGALPYHHVSALTNAALLLAILSGLIGGGLMALAADRPDSAIKPEILLRISVRLWTVLCVLTVIAGLLGILEGRVGLELPPPLDVLLILCLLLVLIPAALTGRLLGGIKTVWIVGLALVIVSTLIGFIPAAGFGQDRLLRAAAVGLRDQIGLVLASVAVLFAVLHRISNITLEWANAAAYSVGGFMTVAGVLLMLPLFITLDAPAWIIAVAPIGVILIPIALAILGAHVYRALADRNGAATLAGHWIALSVILLIAGGAIGAINALPTVHVYTAGTRLTDVQSGLMLIGLVSIGLAGANQAAAELRGRNQRVTGLMPFWLIAFGVIVGMIALAGAGIVQVYLERLLSIGYLETQQLIAPLYSVWVIGAAGLGLGVVIYAAAFWARRIKKGDSQREET